MKIGFIGAGAMAEALIKGLIGSKSVIPEEINCSDISEQRLDYIHKTYGAVVHKNNLKVVESSEVIILAVKPHTIREVVVEIRDAITPEKMILSVAAGISTAAIEAWLGKEIPVVRVMPNTPCLVAEGVSAICPGKYAGKRHEDISKKLLGPVGSVVEVPEKLMNAVTALSGSGPAYIYLIIEALVDAGVALGLPRETAEELAVKTTIGAARMVSETGEHPAVLKGKVMSPGGTTAAALQELEAGKIRATLFKALKAACEKAHEMGE